MAVGSTIKTIGLRFFEKLGVALPIDVSEQRRIACVLNSIDDCIFTLERTVATKTELKRGLMQQLLVGKSRFKEFVKKRGKKHTRFADYPEDWTLLTIGDIAQEISTRNGSNTSAPVLSCTKHDGLVESLKYFGKQVFSDDTSNYKVVRRGQFAYATNHIEEGSIGYQDRFDTALISPIYTVFETDDRVHHGFLYQLLKSELYRHIFEIKTSSSVDRRGSLRWNEFSKIVVALPSYAEQARIAETFHVCNNDIALLEKQAAERREQKAGLMRQLLTGQVRLRPAAA
jgi:type I restriction enzyme S subunit